MIKYIKDQIKLIKFKDPGIKTNLEAIIHPSFKALLYYKISHYLYLKKHYFFAKLISEKAKRKTGIEIHPGATIGHNLFIDHGFGVVIGETTIIGDNVTIYQGVTLGTSFKGNLKGKRHPTIKNNVTIYASAKVLGSFTVHENATIGAGAIVLSEVKPYSTVVGVPARVVKYNNLSKNYIDPIYNDKKKIDEIVKLLKL